MIEIDATSAVLFAAGSVLIALVLCVALRWNTKRDRVMAWLVASNAALLFAGGAVLARPVVGFEVSSISVIALAYTGICCAYFAVLAADQRPLPWRLLTAIGGVSLAVQIPIALDADSVGVLMLTSSVVNSILTLGLAVSVWRVAVPYGSRIAALLSLPFAALCVGYSIRLAVLLIWSDGAPAILASLLIIVAMAWATVILELALIALRESQARRSLRNALREARAAQRARTQFLLGVSHDLRTPLNGILGLSELLRTESMGPLPETYRSHALEIHRNGVELLEMVSDLLVAASEDADQDRDRQCGTIDQDMRDSIRARVG